MNADALTLLLIPAGTAGLAAFIEWRIRTLVTDAEQRIEATTMGREVLELRFGAVNEKLDRLVETSPRLTDQVQGLRVLVEQMLREHKVD